MLVTTRVSSIDQPLENRLRSRIYCATVHTNSGVRTTPFQRFFVVVRKIFVAKKRRSNNALQECRRPNIFWLDTLGGRQ
ncbi:hypothetical protein PSAB6_70210 [Paraburkholderia sabiae]|nr:hypothetical protein PSAB6_70210 [Paraburkholderia sabiae]